MATNYKDPTSWNDGAERERVAEAAYIEYEMYERGDGMWQPWTDVGDPKRAKWLRVADGMIRTLNYGRMRNVNKTSDAAGSS